MKLKRLSRAASAVGLGTCLLVVTTIFAQQLAGPTEDDSKTAQSVAKMITRYHINHKDIDDAIAPKFFDAFLQNLDPQRMYFLATDIDEFGRSKMQLDDQVKDGDVKFAYTVFRRYLKRVDERAAVAHQLIDAKHDFTVDEEFPVEAGKQPWAATADELNDRWRKRVKLDMVNLRIDGQDAAKIKERLHKRYNTLARSIHETESWEVLETYLSSLSHCFDPHSSYMSPETLEEFQIQMRLALDGIGAALRSEDGTTVVAQIVAGGAAEKDGRLKVGDKITAVGQETGDMVDIVEMKLSKVVRMIRGKRGSKVRLQVAKADTGETGVYDLIRQTVELKESEVKGEVINTKGRTGRDSKIGVINIPSFYRDFSAAEKGQDDFKSTARDLQNVLTKFREKGPVDALVLDLRMNGGGSLSEAIEVTGLFIDEGPVVQVKEPNSKVKTYSDETKGAFNEPLIVVCNRLSASASEIFAGAIKDYRRGIVVGDTTTHGKGTVQNVMEVNSSMFSFFDRKNRGALKLTINQFYRVNGDSTQNLGVKSDIVLPSVLDHMDIGESSMENALAFDRIEPAEHGMLAYVNQDLISSLQQKSQNRVAKNTEFDRVRENIREYVDRKSRKTITLNEEKLKEEREKDKSEKKNKDEDEDGNPKADGPLLPVTPYNDELLNIAGDYVEYLRRASTAQR